MSKAQESEQNVASTAAKKWHALVANKLTDEEIVDLWNGHVQAEASEMVRQTTEAGRSRTVRNYKRWRAVFWGENEARLDLTVERTEVGTLRLKQPPKKPTNPKPVVQEVSTPRVVKSTVEASNTKLSATEKAILLATRKPIEAVETVLPRLDDSDAKAMQRAAEEAEANEKRLQEYVLWACQRADAEVETLRKKHGEALWSDAVTVEQYANYPLLRVIFVRSSTAPMFGAHGPTVKHDFRANGKPVTVNHEGMFRQLDNQRLIRSKVVAGKTHEYYVKALQYQEGMYFKGYFVVDGEERAELARFYVCRSGKVITIDEAEYRRLENEAAARRPR